MTGERCPGSGQVLTFFGRTVAEEAVSISDDGRSYYFVCPACAAPVDTEPFIDAGGIPTEVVVAKEHTR